MNNLITLCQTQTCHYCQQPSNNPCQHLNTCKNSTVKSHALTVVKYKQYYITTSHAVCILNALWFQCIGRVHLFMILCSVNLSKHFHPNTISIPLPYNLKYMTKTIHEFYSLIIFTVS